MNQFHLMNMLYMYLESLISGHLYEVFFESVPSHMLYYLECVVPEKNQYPP